MASVSIDAWHRVGACFDDYFLFGPIATGSVNDELLDGSAFLAQTKATIAIEAWSG